MPRSTRPRRRYTAAIDGLFGAGLGRDEAVGEALHRRRVRPRLVGRCVELRLGRRLADRALHRRVRASGRDLAELRERKLRRGRVAVHHRFGAERRVAGRVDVGNLQARPTWSFSLENVPLHRSSVGCVRRLPSWRRTTSREPDVALLHDDAREDGAFGRARRARRRSGRGRGGGGARRGARRPPLRAAVRFDRVADRAGEEREHDETCDPRGRAPARASVRRRRADRSARR